MKLGRDSLETHLCGTHHFHWFRPLRCFGAGVIVIYTTVGRVSGLLPNAGSSAHCIGVGATARTYSGMKHWTNFCGVAEL